MGSIVKHSKPVLVVSGDVDEQEKLRQCAARYTAEFPLVRYADTFADALQAIREQLPACCIVDYQIDGVSTQENLKRLRKEFPDATLPVIVMVAAEHEEQVAEFIHNGAQGYLIKEAITPPTLHGAILTALRSSSLQKQVTHLEHYDPLTGLLNRTLFMNRLDLAVKRCDRYADSCALLYVNLDGFKPVNDSYGLVVGDALLQAVAERIKRNCRSTDSAARSNADEFVLLLEHIDSHAGHKVAEKLLRALAEPYEIDGQSLLVNASVGLALYPDTANSADDLIKQADQALVQAKHDAQSQLVCFSEKHRSQWMRQRVLEKDLPKAIARGDLALAYQPIVCAETYQLKRLEVLTRWPRDDFPINPLELMEMIDRLNLVQAFHDWLFDSAFVQLGKWDKEGVHPDLCLNIPANYCYSPAISTGIRNTLQAYSIDPSRVELEITESTLMKYPDKSIRVLKSLHDHGLRVAVDDFGTGYSSMAYLSRLPLDTLKIDRHFFLDDSYRDRNRKIIDAIAALGHSLELEIIAEGVETEVQLALAKSVGCDLLQGYFFGKPEFAGGSWADYVKHFNDVGSPNGSLKGQKGPN